MHQRRLLAVLVCGGVEETLGGVESGEITGGERGWGFAGQVVTAGVQNKWYPETSTLRSWELPCCMGTVSVLLTSGMLSVSSKRFRNTVHYWELIQ